MKRVLRALGTAATLIGTATVQATPLIVIHEGANTVSAAPYYQKFKAKQQALDSALKNTQRPTLVKPTLRAAVNVRAFFPVVSPSLRPGVPTIKRIAKLTQPLFLIGMDDQSMIWLRDNFAQLKTMVATGIVVNAAQYGRFAQLQANAARLGVEINALGGEGIARMYGVRTYPVLLVGY